MFLHTVNLCELWKTLYYPEDPKDLEELFHSLDSDDEVYRQIQDAESLKVALIPPDYGETVTKMTPPVMAI
nr:unnamed protein product [Callosobruchus analis]